ncbi:MAG: RsmE family RNA methyltransferase [Elusimicrobiota bacterium]|jgi:16S rRNA (uracil1498-N3)-methyltransferase
MTHFFHRKSDVKRTQKGRYDAAGDGPLELPSLGLGTPFRIETDLARRLIRREVNPKEAFTVRDAAGIFFRASVKELSENGGLAVPYEKLSVSPEPCVEITLACAVLGRQRMLFVAQKATELGVSRILPLLTEHSVPPQDLDHEKAHAWPGQIIRAAKQCRRSSLPELRAPMDFDAFLASPFATQTDLFLCLDNVSGETQAPAADPKRILLLIGPEGGFSDAERKKLEGKARSWILGGRVLRAETAVLAGLTAVHLRWGDFR